MEMLLYLAKVSVCTGVFFLFYHFVLSKFTFFSFNRWYLLITLSISFIVPILTFQVERKIELLTVAIPQNNFAISSNNASLNMDPEFSFENSDTLALTFENVLVLVYGIGALFSFTRFINGLLQLIKNGRKYTKNKKLKYILVSPNNKLKNSSSLTIFS